MRRLDHCRAVLVGTGRLFGDAPHRRALDDDAAPAKLVHHLAATPLLQRLMAAQASPSAVARRGKCTLRPQRRSDHDRRRCAHATADENRLACGGKDGRQVWMTRTESARGTLAMDEEAPALAVGLQPTGLSRGNLVLFLLAGVVRDVEQHGKREFGIETGEDPAR